MANQIRPVHLFSGGAENILGESEMKKKKRFKPGSLAVAFLFLIGIMMLIGSCSPRRTNLELEFTEGTDMEAVPSPDGRQIALQLWQHIWILDVAGGEARVLTNPVTPPDEHWFPRWSPDGKSIVFSSLRTDAGLLLVPVSGGQSRQLTDGEFDFWPSWSPDGKAIVFERKRALWTVPAEGGTLKRLTQDPLSATQPAWSPDGKWIAFSSNGQISIISPDGGSVRQVTSGSQDGGPSWSPDNKNLFFISRRSSLPQIWSIALEGGEPKQLTNESDLYNYSPRWMPGRNALVYTAGGKIHVLDLTSGIHDVIPFRARLKISRESYKRKSIKIPMPGERLSVRGIYRPAPSPEGDRIAFAALGDLWIRHKDGRIEQITSGPADDGDPAWSPDGQSLCFVSNRNGDYQVFVISLRDHTVRPVTEGLGDAETPLWHPSGEKIIFTHSSRPPLKQVPAQGGIPQPAVKTTGMDLRPLGWQPGDQSLIYSKLYSAEKTYEMKMTIERAAPDGTGIPLEVGPPEQAEFAAMSPDGKRLAYVSCGELWVRSMEKGTDWKKIASGPVFFPSWSSDGRMVYVAAGKLMRLNVDTGKTEQLSLDLSYKVPRQEGSLLLQNARLLTPELKEGRRDLLIKDGRIQSIDPSGAHHRQADRIIDLEGKSVIPGLFDTHAHLFKRLPTEGYLFWGVTSIGGAGEEGHWAVSQQEAIESGRREGPRIFPAGGFVVTSWMNAYPQFLRIKTQEQLDRYMDHLNNLGAAQVKSYLRRDPWVEAVAIDLAHRRGLPVLSHFIRPAGVAAGLDRKEHTYYYTSDGEAMARFRQDVIEILRKANITVSTTSTALFIYTKQGRARISELLTQLEVSRFLPPAQQERLTRMVGAAESEASFAYYDRWLEASKANAADVHRAGVKVVVGTDYSPFLGFLGVHWEMEFLVQAGLTPLEALRAATQEAALALGLEGQLGIIAPGAVADLVVLDADPLEDIRNTKKIHTVIKGGKIIDRSALRTVGSKLEATGQN